MNNPVSLTKRIEALWRCLYATGVSDMLRGLHLLSYLFLVKALEERSFRLGPEDTAFATAAGADCHWSVIKERARIDGDECARHLRERVGPWLRSLDPDSCLGEAAPVFAQLLPAQIFSIMDSIDVLCAQASSLQVAFADVLAYAEQGEAFNPKAGQIMTPPHIASLMADLVDPRAGERVIDPACGTANLLVAAWQTAMLRQSYEPCVLADGRALCEPGACGALAPSLTGYDNAPLVIPVAFAHLLACLDELPKVRCSDTLSGTFSRRMREPLGGEYDVVLGNPPYGGYLDHDDLCESLRALHSQESALLFVKRALQLLRPGGRAALLLPEGVVRNLDRASVALRRELVEQHRLLAVASLPQGIFLPQAAIKTTLVLLSRGEPGGECLMYHVRSDGYTFQSPRRPAPFESDLFDLRFQVAAYHGLRPPTPVPDWWEQFALESRLAPGSSYVTPVTREERRHPFTGEPCDPFLRLAGFEVRPAREEQRAWLVGLEEVRDAQYSLCVEDYCGTGQERPHRRASGSHLAGRGQLQRRTRHEAL